MPSLLEPPFAFVIVRRSPYTVSRGVRYGFFPERGASVFDLFGRSRMCHVLRLLAISKKFLEPQLERDDVCQPPRGDAGFRACDLLFRAPEARDHVIDVEVAKLYYKRFACEQPPYSVFTRHIEMDVLEVARRYGVGVIVWSPLAGGWLTGKYRRGERPAEDSRAVRFAQQGRPVAARYDVTRPGNQRKLDAVEELAFRMTERGKFRDALKPAQDMERLIARIALSDVSSSFVMEKIKETTALPLTQV